MDLPKDFHPADKGARWVETTSPHLPPRISLVRTPGAPEGKEAELLHEMEQQDTERLSRLVRRYQGLMLLAVVWVCLAGPGVQAQTEAALPDAPSALLFSSSRRAQSAGLQAPLPQAPATQPPATQAPETQPPATQAPLPQAPETQPPLPQAPMPQAGSTNVPPCPNPPHRRLTPKIFEPSPNPICETQLVMIVGAGYVKPLTSRQKGVLAFREWSDPFTFLTIAMFSGVSVAADPYSVYGPGFPGWGRLAGYLWAEDTQGDFTSIYVIPSLVHEDPRYHRMPEAVVARRIEHALIHPFVTQHDDGSLMPNYATLINVPFSAEISNLYVPEIGTNLPDTAKRVLVGYAVEPIGPLLAEFLPDVARRVHLHIVFAQQLLNRLALGSGASPSSY